MVNHSGSFDAHDISHHRQVRVCVSACACACTVGWGGGARPGTHMRLVLQKMRTREPGDRVLICWMRWWSFSCALVRVGVGVRVSGEGLAAW